MQSLVAHLRISGSAAWRSLFHVPLAGLLACSLLLAWFSAPLPGGVDLSGGPGAFLVLAAIVWALAFTARLAQPSSRLATGIESLALFLPVILVATFASVSMAVGSGPFVDKNLVAIDQALFPFVDVRAVILGLPHFPKTYAVLAWFYNSMIWQPFAFLAVATVFGNVRDNEYFLSAWSTGLLLCLLPFHWLPALSPYNYYGIQPAAVPGTSVAMPWQFLPIMTGLRDGSIGTLSIHQLAGMVTVPSFHACAATMLARSWWRYRLLRWPMLALNAGMALAAIPIGSHYVIDIAAGVAVGLAASAFAAWFVALKDRARPVSTVPERAPEFVTLPA
ncbi:MAG: phosphatase PAP2 family protein [Tsuneonella sp.]